MTDEKQTEDEFEKPGPTGEGIETEPRGNPDTDEGALERGEEVLDRVKPY